MLPLDGIKIIKPEHLCILAELRSVDLITAQDARRVIEALCSGEATEPLTILRQEGMLDTVDETQIESILQGILSANQKAVEDYLGGRKAAFGHLMGEAMRACPKGTQPKDVKSKLEELIR